MFPPRGKRAEPSWWRFCSSDEVEGIMTLSWLSISDSEGSLVLQREVCELLLIHSRDSPNVYWFACDLLNKRGLRVIFENGLKTESEQPQGNAFCF